MPSRSINPATGNEVASYPETSPAEVRASLERAQAAFHTWRRVEMDQRAKRMRAAADLFLRGRVDHAELMAREMGKPIMQGEAEVEKCASACDYYGEHAAQFLAREPVPTEAASSFIAF